MNEPHDNRCCDGTSCPNTFFVNGVLVHPTIEGTQKRARMLFCSEKCRDDKQQELDQATCEEEVSDCDVEIIFLRHAATQMTAD